MSFRPSAVPPDLDRLKTSLLKSGIQSENNPLFQVISQLIDAVRRNQEITNNNIAAAGGTGSVDEDYLTHTNESVDLPNSRQLLAGTKVTFNDATPNERTVNIDDVADDDDTYLTVDDESPTLPNSRRLLAGTGITFDDVTPNERTVSSAGGGSGAGYWSPLVLDGEDNGDSELILTDVNAPIVVWFPTP